MTNPDRLMGIREADALASCFRKPRKPHEKLQFMEPLKMAAVMQQFADTMRENERLREALWRIAGKPGAATTDESPELKCSWYEAIASKALSNKDLYAPHYHSQCINGHEWINAEKPEKCPQCDGAIAFLGGLPTQNSCNCAELRKAWDLDEHQGLVCTICDPSTKTP